MGGCSTARSMPWHLPSIHVANRDAWRGGSADGELSLTGMLSWCLGLDHGFRLRCTSSTWGEAWIMVDESGHKRVGGGNLAGCDFQVVSLWVQDAALALFGTQQHTRIALNAGTVRLRGLGERPDSVARTGKDTSTCRGVSWSGLGEEGPRGCLLARTRTRATDGRMMPLLNNGRAQQWTTVREQRQFRMRRVSTPVR